MVKRRTKVNKKRVLRKAILMYDRSKGYYSENWSKRETSSQKTNCLFNVLAVLEADR